MPYSITTARSGLSSRCTPQLLFVADRIQAQADDNPTWQTQEPFARY
ncbi:hypothetical protein ULF88_06145 [Halopseudomonas pachastrellae]|nr:hypothetical protein [Halopseudomonas pachastrellae]